MIPPFTKRKYKDKADAVFALHGIVNKKDGRKKPIRCYECPDCFHWHLTSKPLTCNPRNNNQKLTLLSEWNKLLNT